MPRSAWLTEREVNGGFIDFLSHIALFECLFFVVFFFCLIGLSLVYFYFHFLCFCRVWCVCVFLIFCLFDCGVKGHGVGEVERVWEDLRGRGSGIRI